MLQIKLCGFVGVKNVFDVCSGFPGVTHIGLNFYNSSPRYVSIQEARLISQNLQKYFSKIKIVGVFVNANEKYIDDVIEKVPLEILQFSGDEGNDEIRKYKKTHVVWKVIHLENNEDILKTEKYPDVQRFLIDSKSKNFYGGTGKQIDVQLAKQFIEKFPSAILAGGVTPDNIENILDVTKAQFVDIASGVEEKPGVKSLKKIEKLMKIVKL